MGRLQQPDGKYKEDFGPSSLQVGREGSISGFAREHA
jgi:hypothetical protein